MPPSSSSTACAGAGPISSPNATISPPGSWRSGLKKGDRIGIWSPNRPEWLLTQFATARLGLILVNINPAYRVSELEFALNKVGCKALDSRLELQEFRLHRAIALDRARDR